MVEVHIIRENEGIPEFLLLKRGEKEIYPGLWQMVTGKIEEGEKAYEAALRELKEEAGLIPIRFWVVPNINRFYSPEEDSIHLLPVFAALVEGNSQVTICEEHCEWGWYSAEEAKRMLTWEGQRRSVEIIVNYFTLQRPDLDLLAIAL